MGRRRRENTPRKQQCDELVALFERLCRGPDCSRLFDEVCRTMRYCRLAAGKPKDDSAETPPESSASPENLESRDDSEPRHAL
jgi:hypothetical protein